MIPESNTDNNYEKLKIPNTTSINIIYIFFRLLKTFHENYSISRFHFNFSKHFLTETYLEGVERNNVVTNESHRVKYSRDIGK